MSDKNSKLAKKSYSPDWFVRGILTKLGDIFDSLTGRKWQPSNSLATSELGEKLKILLDEKVQNLGVKGQFVPHKIFLKMQWDKFSTDSEKPLTTLKNELLNAAADHINDHHYHTFAPLDLEIKTDYFTEGVVLNAGFGNGDSADDPGIVLTVPDLPTVEMNPSNSLPVETEKYIAEFFIKEKKITKILNFKINQRLSVGRGVENDLVLDDPSVSKIHATIIINTDRILNIADTGSTNGTFINEQRISYGKSYQISQDDKIMFGSIEVIFSDL